MHILSRYVVSFATDLETTGGETTIVPIATTTRRMWREHPSRAVQLFLILAIVAYLLVKQAASVLG